MSGLRAVIALEWMKLARARGPRLAAAAIALTVLATWAARYADGTAEQAVRAGLDGGFAHLLVYVLAFSLASGSVSEEVSARTLIYLTVRPVPRPLLALAKWMVCSATAAGLMFAGVLLLHVGCYATEPGALFEALPGTLRAGAALSLLTAYLCGACTLWSALLPAAASIMCTLHLVGELAMSLAPGRMRLLSASYHAQELSGFARRGLWSDQVPDLSPSVHALVLAVVCALAVAATAFVMQQSEYRTSENE